MLSGCNVDMQIDDGKGVPLAELDTSGASPGEIVLAGPDTVIVSRGETFAIDVSGDQAAVDALRFHLEDDSLAVSRLKNSGNKLGTATVRVTMPSLTAMVMAGSGTIEVDEITERADATIAGSGTIKVSQLNASRFDLTVAGSGDFEAAGRVESLDLTVAGSGSARMADLSVDKAEISIMGSGDVKVTGSATCTVSAMGSGKLRCSAGTARSADAGEAPAAPEAPEASEAP